MISPMNILAVTDNNFQIVAISAVVLVFIIFFTILLLAKMYKRCPSDRILVIYGKVKGNRSAHCIHGGAAFIVPLIQDSAYLSLTPMTIGIPLQNALSFQNIRINVPSTFTVGISTEPSIMVNAAERLLGLRPNNIEDMAKEIITGQLRLTVASLTIEQINQDRESFLVEIRKNVELELNKIGLNLINVNIIDITDESNYINSIGKKAAAEAINKAKVDVALQTKVGAIGESENTREMTIRVAGNVAEAEKGKKQAEANQRVYVAEQETAAMVGEAEAKKLREIRIMQNLAEAEKGKMQAVADQRVFVAGQERDAINGEKKAAAEQRVFVADQESTAVEGENKAKAQIADSNARLAVRAAEAQRIAEVAKREAEVAIQKAQYKAEVERLNAAEIAQREIDRQKVIIAAEAEAEKIRRIAKGEADGVLLKYQAEAQGLQTLLEGKAQGYQKLVTSTGGDTKAAATMLMIEKLEEIVARQTEAIRNIKIDRITVWDGGGAGGEKGSSTANFISSLMKALPPMQDVAAMAGVELPSYLGKIKAEEASSQKPEAGSQK
ncbi:MAG: SPFH domain-containing protein [Phycisphaerales bacterium]|nr:SPFH domain-containing protein [Phycisphaerales bacterium]